MRLIHQFALSTALAGYAVQAIFDNFETSNYNASKEINALKACPTARNQAYDYIVVGKRYFIHNIFDEDTEAFV